MDSIPNFLNLSITSYSSTTVAIASRGTPPALPGVALKPLACHRCGTFDTPRVEPGTGPHALQAMCRHCGAYLQWVSVYSPEERQARREEHRRAAMAKKPASAKQLEFLKALGDAGPVPATMDEASQRIDAARRGQEGR
jgi:hypothetical protein